MTYGIKALRQIQMNQGRHPGRSHHRLYAMARNRNAGGYAGDGIPGRGYRDIRRR